LGFKWNLCHAKVKGPLIDIHSNTHAFRAYVFKSLKFNQWICSTISLLFNLIFITEMLQAMHESKGLTFFVVMGLRLRWGKRKEKKRLKPKEVEHSKKMVFFKTRYPIKAHKFFIFKHQCLTSFDFKFHQHRILRTQRNTFLFYFFLLFTFSFTFGNFAHLFIKHHFFFSFHIISNHNPWDINKYMLY